VRVDVHSHYLPRALASALEGRSTAPLIRATEDGGAGRFIEYGPGSGTPLSAGFTDIDLILERMDEARIDHAVLSVTIPGVDWLDEDEAVAVAAACNDETAGIVARNRARFSGLATVPLQSPARAVDELRRATGLGLNGAMIYSNVAGAYLDAPERRAFFAAAAELDVTVMLHPTYPICAAPAMTGGLMEMAGFLFDTTHAALRLVFDGLYERHPRFKFFVPHAGSFIPYISGRIDMVAAARPGAMLELKSAPGEQIRRFYVDTVTASPRTVRYVCDFFGADHVMYGTDHPFWPMPSGEGALRGAGLNAEELAKVEHETATQLFGLN
jgi:predicted TIM-barrel fold metal-dependent hydrolase